MQVLYSAPMAIAELTGPQIDYLLSSDSWEYMLDVRLNDQGDLIWLFCTEPTLRKARTTPVHRDINKTPAIYIVFEDRYGNRRGVSRPAANPVGLWENYTMSYRHVPVTSPYDHRVTRCAAPYGFRNVC